MKDRELLAAIFWNERHLDTQKFFLLDLYQHHFAALNTILDNKPIGSVVSSRLKDLCRQARQEPLPRNIECLTGRWALAHEPHRVFVELDLNHLQVYEITKF